MEKSLLYLKYTGIIFIKYEKYLSKMHKKKKMSNKLPIKAYFQLDKKDRKILQALFSNGRIPISQIAKRVALSKEVVGYRLKRMEETGILIGHNTIISVKKLGWEMAIVSFRLRNIDIEKEKKIIEHLKKHPHVAWVVKCIGNYDIVTKMFVQNMTKLQNIVKIIEEMFYLYIDDYKIDILLKEQAVPLSFLYDTKDKTSLYTLSQDTEQVPINKLDLQILKNIATNARMTIGDLASRVAVSRDVVSYHIKALEKNKIILKYRPSTWVDVQKMGYSWYILRLKVGKLSSSLEQSLTSFLLNYLYVTYFYKTMGNNDLQIELRLPNTIELNTFLMEIRSILKEVLKQFELLLILEEHKYTYFPECLESNTKHLS